MISVESLNTAKIARVWNVIRDSTRILIHNSHVMKHPLLLLLAAFLSLNTFAQFDESEVHGENVTESPYFVVCALEGTLNPGEFALKGTHTEVNVSGVIAEVTVEQTYVNDGSATLDATYIFPGSTHAAVYAMEMQVGEHKVVAKIKEKGEAQQIYAEAKEDGKTASLMQQHRPNVFQMDVTNIRPKNVVKVRFSYTENLVPVNNEYGFVFPTIVGPRYADADGLEQDPWVLNPYTNTEHPVAKYLNPSFTLDFNLNAGMPISSAKCTSYPDSELQYIGRDELTAHLSNSQYQQAKNEYVFKYKLLGDKISTGMLTYDHGDEKFFMMTVQPPKNYASDEIPPRDYMFIVDISGSMSGFPLDVSKELIRSLLSSLDKGDRFNLLLFASGYGVYSEEMIEVTPSEINKAIEFMSERHAGGGTRILPAVEEALDMIDDNGRSVSIILATDGLVTVEREAFDLITQSQSEANFFPFGIGSHMNRYLIEGLAHVSHTEPMICTNMEDAKSEAKRFKEMVSQPLLTDIDIDWGDSEVYDVIPAAVPDLFAQKPLVVYGKYRGKMDNKVTVSGKSGTGDYAENVKTKSTEKEDKNGALRYLWARQKLKVLSDYAGVAGVSEFRPLITEVGLEYSLLSKYTSFVAVDERTIVEGIGESLDREPIQEQAYYGGGVPEPGEWALIILSIIVLGAMLFLVPWKLS